MKRDQIRKTVAITLGMILCFAIWAGNDINVKAASHGLSTLQVGDILTVGDILLDDLSSSYFGVECLGSEDYDDTAFGHDHSPYSPINHIFRSPEGVRLANSIEIMDAPYLDTVNPDKKWIVCCIKDGGVLFQAIFLPAPVGSYSLTPAPTDTVGPVTAAGCAHTCEWVTESPATETTDGQMAYKCTKCGAITQYRTGGTGESSAYAVFNQNAIRKVQQAESGATVHIDTGIWASFSQEVMAAIAARRDVIIELTYRLGDKSWKIIIPAQAEVPADVPFAGFDGYLAGLFGKTEN